MSVVRSGIRAWKESRFIKRSQHLLPLLAIKNPLLPLDLHRRSSTRALIIHALRSTLSDDVLMLSLSSSHWCRRVSHSDDDVRACQKQGQFSPTSTSVISWCNSSFIPFSFIDRTNVVCFSRYQKSSLTKKREGTMADWSRPEGGGTRNSWMISANFLPGPFLFWRNLPLRFRFAWLRTKYNTVNEADNKAKGNVYKIIIIIFEKKWFDERRRNKRAADERERERERESVKWKVRHIAPRPNE